MPYPIQTIPTKRKARKKAKYTVIKRRQNAPDMVRRNSPQKVRKYKPLTYGAENPQNIFSGRGICYVGVGGIKICLSISGRKIKKNFYGISNIE